MHVLRIQLGVIITTNCFHHALVMVLIVFVFGTLRMVFGV